MLRSILYTILAQVESAFFHFQQEFRKFRCRDSSEWPYDSLKKVLSSFAGRPSTKPLYLILDAMDESEEADRLGIIQLLCKLCAKENPCNIKAFLASRPLAELKHHIQEHHHVIKMQDENTGDISRFADDFLTRDLKFTGKILTEARDYITKHAQGVFVWVWVIKNELRHAETGYSDSEVLGLLKDLPQELEELYERMFSRLEKGFPRDIQVGKMLFRFVFFALRPLTVEELRDALAVPDPRYGNCYGNFLRNKMGEIGRRIEHCGSGFLEIKGKPP